MITRERRAFGLDRARWTALLGLLIAACAEPSGQPPAVTHDAAGQGTAEILAASSELLAGEGCGVGHRFCAQGEFCQFAESGADVCGDAGGPGQCSPLPRFCPQIVMPVCGCDGQTYTNGCKANRAGTSVRASGECGNIATIIELGGQWLYGGRRGPVITVIGNVLHVDMSIFGRPLATGTIIDSTTIRVTFPDDATYTGSLRAPGTIHWSNNSEWTRPIATIFDLNGRWLYGGQPGPVISVDGNTLAVDMSAYVRPTAHGTVLDASTISVTFSDDATFTGRLQLPGTIYWSNNSAWTKP